MDNDESTIDKVEEFFGIAKSIRAKTRTLETLSNNLNEMDLTSLEQRENLEADIDELYRDLPIFTEEEWEQVEEWNKLLFIEMEICPFCCGEIVTLPISNYNYKVECEQCGRIYEED